MPLMPDSRPKISLRQAEALHHLRKSGGMTMPALGVLMGAEARKILRRLLARGLVRVSEYEGVRLFLAANTPAPASEEAFRRRVALGWLYARAVQAGCCWQAGLLPEVVFPAGARFKVAWRGKVSREENGAVLALLPDRKHKVPELPGGSLVVFAEPLREMSFREALTKSSR